MQYWCKFDESGHVIGTSTEAKEGYVETPLEDLQKYLEPHGIDTGGYVRDAQTGKPVVASPSLHIDINAAKSGGVSLKDINEKLTALEHERWAVVPQNDGTPDAPGDNYWRRLGAVKDTPTLKALRMFDTAPEWLENDYAAGVAFGHVDTLGVISLNYRVPSITFTGGNYWGRWWMRVQGGAGCVYNLAQMQQAANTIASLEQRIAALEAKVGK